MIEVFFIVCMILVIGLLITQMAKGAGHKISRLAVPHSGCSAYLSDDADHYIISYIGPNNHIEYERVNYIKDNIYWNCVDSLKLDGRMFEAQIIREDYRLVQYKKDTVRAATLKELKGEIEKQFKGWNSEYRHQLELEWEQKDDK